MQLLCCLIESYETFSDKNVIKKASINNVQLSQSGYGVGAMRVCGV